ncbi:MAG: hypothetical protein OEY22_06930 [Candidatus Bathyarchaeota archaeon]|nr:hypothetical protein [Candidatus Bathyarchaeota archaeon]MDH5788486.1 hypothetical protein [Candidatus Bathyarchaeota archaeon]
MKGAIIFIIVFLIFLGITLAYAELPLGNTISDAINIDPNVEWSGLRVRTLASAIFNGIIYGVIAWLIYTIVEKARK